MNLNNPKTKFMEIKFSLSGPAYYVILEGETVEKVNTVNLLSLWVQILLNSRQRLKFIKIKIHCS